MEFHQEKNGKERECLVIDKLVDSEIEVENELDIVKIGSYNGKNVSAPNISRIKVRKTVCFRTVTQKELYDAIDSIDNSESPSPGIFNAWAVKAAKFAIGTHLHFVFKTCISKKYFPENSKLAFICPVYKKGDVKICENYRPISITTSLQNSLSVYFSIRLTNLYKKKKN